MTTFWTSRLVRACARLVDSTLEMRSVDLSDRAVAARSMRSELAVIRARFPDHA